jgi:hypothetical protein
MMSAPYCQDSEIQKSTTDWTFRQVWGRLGIQTENRQGDVLGDSQLEDPEEHWRITLRWILDEFVVRRS